MKLGFDVDGIVADMATLMIEKANEKFGFNYTVDIFKRHSPFKNVYINDDRSDFNNQEVAQFMIEEVIHNKNALVHEVQPYPEGIYALRKLRKAGHSLHFITARKEEEHECTVTWFRKHNVPFDTIHSVGHKGKGMLGRSLNLDFYVDDVYRHIEAMYKFKKRWRKGLVLFTRPWNMYVNIDASLYTRVASWEELFRHVGIHNR